MSRPIEIRGPGSPSHASRFRILSRRPPIEPGRTGTGSRRAPTRAWLVLFSPAVVLYAGAEAIPFGADLHGAADRAVVADRKPPPTGEIRRDSWRCRGTPAGAAGRRSPTGPASPGRR